MKNHEMSVHKDDIELAEQISRDHPGYQGQVFTAVLTALLISRVGQKDTRIGSVVRHSPKPIAATEFFAKLRPSHDVDKVLGAAYFLETYGHASDFTADEIKKCLLQGKVKPPSNVSLALLRNAQKGLMTQTEKDEGRKKSWLLTQTGVAALEETLQFVARNQKQTEKRQKEKK